MGKKRTRNQFKPEVVEHTLHVLSNDPQGWKYDLLQMFLEGAINNQIGYMDALHKDTGENHRILVGLQYHPDGKVEAFPLARLFETDEVERYIAPDGKGGWDGLEEPASTADLSA